MSRMRLKGDAPVLKMRPGPVLDASYLLDGVSLEPGHHDDLYRIAKRMTSESPDEDYRPTYEQVVKYALQMTAAQRR